MRRHPDPDVLTYEYVSDLVRMANEIVILKDIRPAASVRQTRRLTTIHDIDM